MVDGVLLILAGILKLYQGNELVDSMIMFISIVALAIIVVPFVFKCERSDEMFHRNFQKSGLWTFIMLFIIIFVIWTVSGIFSFKFDMGVDEICTLLLGLAALLFGYFFGKFERGDA